MREDWIEIEINEVANLYQPKTISSKMLVSDGKYPVYGANGIIGNYDHYNHENEEFLITCRGATCGNVHITQPFSWINGNAMVVQPYNKSLLSLEYLRFVFSNKGRVQKAISGSAQPQITRTTLSPIKIPLSPLPEQRAIVAKIEELFSDLDKGVADLKKAQDQLKVYRQAVLKKSFEGELTKEWRERNESHWQQHRLGDILKVSSGKGLTAKNMSGTGFPVYGGNGISGYHSEYLFEDEKLIIGRVGVKCGVTHITQRKSWVTDNALIVQFVKSMEYSLKFMKLKLQFENLNKLSSSTAQPVISGVKIYAYEISTPEINEQLQIVQEIESRLSVCDKVEENITQSLEKAKALRQSILKKAFEGNLLSTQEIEKCKAAADYEPAAVLLQKIKNL